MQFTWVRLNNTCGLLMAKEVNRRRLPEIYGVLGLRWVSSFTRPPPTDAISSFPYLETMDETASFILPLHNW